MADPGWCNDPADARLARWYDGERWTEHTVVKADWPGPGAPPPPAGLEPVKAFPTEEAVPVVPLRATGPLPPPPLPPTGIYPPTPLSRAGERYRSWPLWGRIAGPVLAVLLLLAAIGAAHGDDGEPVSSGGGSLTSTTVERQTTTSTSVATTTSTAVTTTEATTTTAAPATTVKKASPAPTAPPATQPPATHPSTTPPPASSCDPNYSGCLDPSSEDYDCAGGGGNGPDYTGTVQVYGEDRHRLDADHDGVGCET